MPRSRCCIRRATTTTGYCAPNCIGAAARTAASTTAPTAIRRMLSHLQLRDLVLVDQAELEFGPGLTALTGETGAGKSIVVDALLLIAGGRAGADVVRQGAERAEISASFAALSGAASGNEQQRIDDDGLTGAGFAGQCGEPGTELELGLVDENQIAQLQVAEHAPNRRRRGRAGRRTRRGPNAVWSAILYTSDAADDLLCVNLGGRRI